MEDGFIKVAAAAPKLRVGDPVYNAHQIIEWVNRAALEGVQVLVFPELSITGYTCGDLFFHKTLLDGAERALHQLCQQTQGLDILFVVGLPVQVDRRLYNCAAVVCKGRVQGLVPKQYPEEDEGLPESWYFSTPQELMGHASLMERDVPCHPELTFTCEGMPQLMIGIELGNNAVCPTPPSFGLAAKGVTLILNPAARPETMAAHQKRRESFAGLSQRLTCAYVSAGAGMGESTTDFVYGGHCLIAELGEVLAEAHPFSANWAVSEIDIEALSYLQRQKPRHPTVPGSLIIPFELELRTIPLTRMWTTLPFVPGDVHGRAARYRHILNIQAWGLKKRMEHIGVNRAVIGISGGLDSTMALMAACRAFDLMALPLDHIKACTLPCFGTGTRTRTNAEALCAALGIPLTTIDITSAVRQHFADIGQEESCHDLTFENAQARERTQVLMDIAGQFNAIVIGTGDLSELALGWATYNGDHMSMYNVNGSIPKTLMRDILDYLAEEEEGEALARVLRDILDTPISPELIPGKHGEIGQKTETLIGDYRLHDFFLYHFLVRGIPPKKLCRIAAHAFEGTYEIGEIIRCLKIFFRRFITQQYKRSCSPDGPCTSGLSLSPRGGLVMPSDASFALWQAELERLSEHQSNS